MNIESSFNLRPVLETPLYHDHLRLKARMVEFAGWRMPIHYESGLIEEHQRVRTRVGIFDVSHMGEIRVQGSGALETLQWVTTNDVSVLKSGEAQYSLLSNEVGGVLDDVIVYCLDQDKDYLICVNAANTQKDWNWISSHNRGKAHLRDESSQWGQIAIQGPQALHLCERIFGPAIPRIPFRVQSFSYKGATVYFATTGYTGERGCEVFLPRTIVPLLWWELLERGQDLEILPVGLGARDTLRMEMKYPLYGHELEDKINPYEAGLGWAIKPRDKDFIGRDIMLSKTSKNKLSLSSQVLSPALSLVGFKMLERGIPRQGYRIFVQQKDGKVQDGGYVTSGTHSPSLNHPIGIGFVGSEHSVLGTRLFVDIRGRRVGAQVVPTPFVRTSLSSLLSSSEAASPALSSVSRKDS